MRRVHNQLDTISLDQVNGVGTAFLYFVDAIDSQAGGFENVGGAVRGHQLEAHVDEATGDIGHLRLVVVGDADEDCALDGQFLAGGNLGFGESFAEIVGDAHDFSGGTHFWAEDGVDSGKFRPGEDRRFHVEAAAGVEVRAALDVFWKELTQLAPGHQPGGDFGHWDSRGFGNEGHGARGARVDFEHVNLSIAISARFARNGELHVHQADHFQGTRQLEGVVAHAIEQRLGNINRGQHAGGVARVDAGFLDVLHDAANDYVFAVGERVYVDLNGVFEEFVDQDGTILRILDGLLHVLRDGVFVVGDDHGSSAENVRRADENGETNFLRGFDGFFDRGDHGAGSLRDVEFIEQFTEALAVLG